jgi:hypothetical protein
MKKRTANALFYLAVLISALWLNSTFAQGEDGVWTAEDWRGEASAACGGDIACTEYVLDVIQCESGGDPGAVSNIPNPENGTHDYGLLQVNDYLWDGSSMTPTEQIDFLLNPPPGAWWVCG